MIKYGEVVNLLAKPGVISDLEVNKNNERSWYTFNISNSNKSILNYIYRASTHNWKVTRGDNTSVIVYNILNNSDTRVGRMLDNLLESRYEPKFKQEYSLEDGLCGTTIKAKDYTFEYETIYREEKMDKEINEQVIIHGTMFSNPNKDVKLAMSCIMKHVENISILNGEVNSVIEALPAEVPAFFRQSIDNQIKVEQEAIDFISRITILD